MASRNQRKQIKCRLYLLDDRPGAPGRPRPLLATGFAIFKKLPESFLAVVLIEGIAPSAKFEKKIQLSIY